MRGFFRRFFKGISWVQLLAGGLAAGTVFLLSARLGQAGTIIGAVIASVASTFSSQLYQNILNESQKKIKTVAEEAKKGSGPAKGETPSAMIPPIPAPGAAEKTRVASPVAVSKNRVAVSGKDQGTTAVPAVEETSVLPPVTEAGHDGQKMLPAFEPGTGRPRSPDDSSKATGQNGMRPGASDKSASHGPSQVSAAERARKKKRVAVIVSVALSLLIVAITAGTILLATGGKGTGGSLTQPADQTTDTGNGTSRQDGSSQDANRQQGTQGQGQGQSGSQNGSGQGDGSADADGSATGGASGSGASDGSSTAGSGSGANTGSGSGSGSSDSSSSGSGTSTDNSGSASGSDKGDTGSSDGSDSGSGTSGTTGGKSSRQNQDGSYAAIGGSGASGSSSGQSGSGR